MKSCISEGRSKPHADFLKSAFLTAPPLLSINVLHLHFFESLSYCCSFVNRCPSTLLVLTVRALMQFGHILCVHSCSFALTVRELSQLWHTLFVNTCSFGNHCSCTLSVLVLNCRCSMQFWHSLSVRSCSFGTYCPCTLALMAHTVLAFLLFWHTLSVQSCSFGNHYQSTLVVLLITVNETTRPYESPFLTFRPFSKISS